MKREPIQTEYKGCVFKSKTEAVFARSLDVLGFGYDYEPFYLEQPDGYIPDFCIYGLFSHAAIELKPNNTTDSYLKRLEINASNIVDMLGIGFYCVVTNPWDNTIPVSVMALLGKKGNKRWVNNNDMAITIKHSMEFSKSYRFDLKTNNNVPFFPDINPLSLYNRAMTAMIENHERQRIAKIFGVLA